ncbi:MAG TPA: hypothetical protein VF212_03265 [Longimicrobiales bacterium]
MRVLVSVRTVSTMAVALLLAAAAPVAAQQDKKPDRPTREARRVPERVSRPASRPTTARPATRRPGDRLKPSTRSQPRGRLRAPDRRSDPDRDRRTIDRRLPDRETAAFDAARRRSLERADRARAAGRAGTPEWTIDELLSNPDAPDHVQLLDGEDSPAERARVIAQLTGLFGRQADDADRGPADVEPTDADPAAPHLPNMKFGEPVFEPRQPETPPVNPPSFYPLPGSGNVYPAWFFGGSTSLVGCPGAFYGASFLTAFDALRSWGLGWHDSRLERGLWYFGGSPLYSQSESYRCFGLEFAPQLDWDTHVAGLEAELDDEVVSCARVTVQRVDGAAASFVVPMPALGAETLDELRDAIDARLARGETIDLAVTLRPEDVEDVSVDRCGEEDSLY